MSLMANEFNPGAVKRIEALLTRLSHLERSNRRYAMAASRTIAQHRAYTGSRKDLKGCSALLIRGTHPDIVFVQFDYKGRIDIRHPLTHGWHAFPALAFRLRRVRP